MTVNRMDMNTLGGRIRFARLRSGKTQEDLANKLKVGKDTIKNWENLHSSPSAEFIKPICEYLLVTAGFLCDTIPKKKAESACL